MIGIIVTGHGGFAAGMERNIKMLAGADTKLTAVDFMERMTPEELTEKLTAELEKKADCSMILIATDIMGGTPYNCAATLSVSNPKIRVVGGVNTAFLMEACMCNVVGEDPEDPDQYVEELIGNARESMEKFVLTLPTPEDEMEDGDGI